LSGGFANSVTVAENDRFSEDKIGAAPNGLNNQIEAVADTVRQAQAAEPSQ
jgi:hypothetical protein